MQLTSILIATIFITSLSTDNVVAIIHEAAAMTPEPSQVKIEAFKYNGSGCPFRSIDQELNPMATAIRLEFDEFTASTGPNIPIVNSRKNCNLNFNISVPLGWQFSLSTIDYSGYIELSPNTTALLISSYFFEGMPGQERRELRFQGPKKEDYFVRDSFGVASEIVWSKCDAIRSLNVNTSIRLTGSGGGILTADAINGRVVQVYGIRWRRC
ncbi:hypothetical protein HDV05_000433 [Chytridiales sp. JEL 0842]|nr:hypothetical protein HDV05_000433 [Chytridiales sp. JEL 0842]